MENTIKAIRMKSSGGIIVLSLENLETGAERKFVLRENRDTTVPMVFASTLLNYQGAAELFRQGRILIPNEKHKEAVVKAAEDQYYEVPDVVDTSKIRETLKGNNITEIKALFTGADKEVAFEIAKELKGEMQLAAIEAVETALNFKITEG